jgi:hypothetical protein
VTERWSGRRRNRDLVFGGDGGGGEAAMPEGRVSVREGPRPLIDVWIVHRRQLAAGKAETEGCHFGQQDAVWARSTPK